MEVIRGISVSSLTSVSGRVNSTPPAKSRDWRSGSIDILAYFILEVFYDKVCEGRHLLYCVGIIAIYGGSDEMPKSRGSIALGETEIYWGTFVESLNRRGLHGLSPSGQLIFGTFN